MNFFVLINYGFVRYFVCIGLTNQVNESTEIYFCIMVLQAAVLVCTFYKLVRTFYKSLTQKSQNL